MGSSVDEYLSSQELQNLKQEFLDGKRPTGCIRCWNDEDAGLPSKRTIDKQYIFDANNITSSNGITVLSIPFGNTCNLACRTCNSLYSSKWGTEEIKLSTKFPSIQIHHHKTFYRNKEFIEKLKEVSTNVIDVTFFGGEPFITGIEQQLDFLDFLIDKNPENVSLSYMTNTTMFPDERFWERWKKFKKVNIALSIDATGEKFEYLRWPAKWSSCYENIKKYQEKRNMISNMQLSISHTVSIFNVYYLPTFFSWCLKEKLPIPYIGMVEYPHLYNIKCLPVDVKDAIASRLQGKYFLPVANYMNSGVEGDINTTMEWVNALDTQRKEAFSDVFPELNKLLKQ